MTISKACELGFNIRLISDLYSNYQKKFITASQVVCIREKTDGCAPGFVGVIIPNDTDTNIKQLFLENYKKHFPQVSLHKDMPVAEQFQSLWDFVNTNHGRENIETKKEKFEKFCKESHLAWMIKNDFKDAKSFFNIHFLGGRVSVPRTFFQRTSTCKSLPPWFKSVGARAYGIAKLDSKINKNKETISEVLTLRIVGLLGFQVPQTKILIQQYNTQEEKLCTMTHWNPNLEKVDKVTDKGRYYIPILAINDYDCIGNRCQNCLALKESLSHNSEGKERYDLFSFDFGHAFASSPKKITNIDKFKTNKFDELVGLVNLHSALPRHLFTPPSNLTLDALRTMLSQYDNGKYAPFILQNNKSCEVVRDEMIQDIIASEDIVEDHKPIYVETVQKCVQDFYQLSTKVIQAYCQRTQSMVDLFLKQYFLELDKGKAPSQYDHTLTNAVSTALNKYQKMVHFRQSTASKNAYKVLSQATQQKDSLVLKQLVKHYLSLVPNNTSTNNLGVPLEKSSTLYRILYASIPQSAR